MKGNQHAIRRGVHVCFHVPVSEVVHRMLEGEQAVLEPGRDQRIPASPMGHRRKRGVKEFVVIGSTASGHHTSMAGSAGPGRVDAPQPRTPGSMANAACNQPGSHPGEPTMISAT